MMWQEKITHIVNGQSNRAQPRWPRSPHRLDPISRHRAILASPDELLQMLEQVGEEVLRFPDRHGSARWPLQTEYCMLSVSSVKRQTPCRCFRTQPTPLSAINCGRVRESGTAWHRAHGSRTQYHDVLYGVLRLLAALKISCTKWSRSQRSFASEKPSRLRGRSLARELAAAQITVDAHQR